MREIPDWWRNRATADLPARTAATRLSALDSVRGLAALSVVACHYLIFLQRTAAGRVMWQWLWIPPLSLLSTAYGSVILFFVLSGYVLALSLIGEDSANWLVFAVRRFFRIWPAYAITLIVSFIISHLEGTPQPAAALFNQLGMTTSHITLDRPGWSLVHELRISLAFPLLLLFVRRAPTITLFASFCLYVVYSCGPPWLVTQAPDTTAYVVYFSMGTWLAIFRSRIGRLLQASSLTHMLLCLIGLAFLSVPVTIWYSGVLAGLGACFIIAGVTTSPTIARTLSTRWCEMLGRVSYSLYLTHVVVLLTLMRALGASLRIELTLIAAIPIIGVVAVAGYYCIELPSIRLGRAVAARVAGIQRSLSAGPQQRWVSALAPNGGNARRAPLPQESIAMWGPNQILR